MVKTLAIEKNSDQTQSSIGEGVIKANETSVTIESNQVMPTSKIFVTFRSDYGSRWWIGYQEKGRFVVNVAEPKLDDIKFDWWIVQTEQIDVTQVASPTPIETAPIETPSSPSEPAPLETPSTTPTDTTTTPADTTTTPTTDTTIDTITTSTDTTSTTEPSAIITP
jgi:cell division septation protein DedD